MEPYTPFEFAEMLATVAIPSGIKKQRVQQETGVKFWYEEYNLPCMHPWNFNFYDFVKKQTRVLPKFTLHRNIFRSIPFNRKRG